MPRRRRRLKRHRADYLDFAIGPIDSSWKGISEAEYDTRMRSIEAQWQADGPPMLEEWQAERPGERPWAWWAFQAKEEMPDPWGGEVQRLLELGVMDPEEIEDVIAIGAQVVADQEAGRVAHSAVPNTLRNANLCLAFLGRPLLDEKAFPSPAWAPREERA
jgi:hypothetical protein